MPSSQQKDPNPTDPTEFNAGQLKSEPPKTFGEQLVGISFNPSNDDKVGTAKQLFAQITDLVENELVAQETSRIKGILFNHTIGEILNAQMNVVKLLTLKY